jgi:hypothetical protein
MMGNYILARAVVDTVIKEYKLEVTGEEYTKALEKAYYLLEIFEKEALTNINKSDKV